MPNCDKLGKDLVKLFGYKMCSYIPKFKCDFKEISNSNMACLVKDKTRTILNVIFFCICLECLLWSVCKSQNATQLPDLILLEFGIAISGLVFKLK